MKDYEMTEEQIKACDDQLLNRKPVSKEKKEKMANEFSRVNAIYAQAQAEADAEWDSEE